MIADRIITAIAGRGCDARDIRDAAHEACHALDVKLRGKWERERLHAALERHCGDRGTMIYYEMRARAVEKLVCEGVSAPYDVEHWAMVCWMETNKTMGIDLPSVQWIVEQIKAHEPRSATQAMVRRILAFDRRAA